MSLCDIYILEDLCNYVCPFLKIPLLDFDQTFWDGGDPPWDGFMPGSIIGGGGGGNNLSVCLYVCILIPAKQVGGFLWNLAWW